MKIDVEFFRGWAYLGLAYFGISILLFVFSLLINRVYIFAILTFCLSILALIIGSIGGLIFGYIDSKQEKNK